MGPDDEPTRLTSMDQFTTIYGDRLAVAPNAYDGVDAYFHNGGTVMYFQRLVDGGAESTGDIASLTGSPDTARVAFPGAYGDTVVLEVVTTPGASATEGKKKKGDPEPAARSEFLTYDTVAPMAAGLMANVKLGGKIVATSLPFTANSELQAWCNAGPWIRIDTLATPDDPAAVGSVPFTGGTDGAVPCVAVQSLTDALTHLPKELGPGQESAPGHSDVDWHGAILAHAALTNRVAFLDAARGDTMAQCQAKAAALRGAEQDRYGSLWAPWAAIPGIAPGTTRVVPWSPIQAALCARNDRAGNPNQAVAGQWGQAQWVDSLDTTFTPAECEALLYAGVNTARNIYGSIQAYAFRTLVDPSGPRRDWRELNHARLNMAIVADCDKAGQSSVFAQIDGHGHTVSAFGGAMGGVCLSYFNVDALFGADASEAYVVNTDESVNPPEQLADGVIRAALSVKMSPHAELVLIMIVKNPITVPLV
jgi:hypothetical protein